MACHFFAGGQATEYSGGQGKGNGIHHEHKAEGHGICYGIGEGGWGHVGVVQVSGGINQRFQMPLNECFPLVMHCRLGSIWAALAFTPTAGRYSMKTLETVTKAIGLVAGAALVVCKVRNEWFKGTVSQCQAARLQAGG